MSVEKIKKKYEQISKYLDERERRIWAAVEARSLGHGGIKMVALATGLTYPTIKKGIEELKSSTTMSVEKGRIRRPGGGRKSITEKYPSIEKDLLDLVESSTLGDPTTPLLWTSKSHRKLADELQKKGYSISYVTVGPLLKKIGYSLQANKKTKGGSKNPDRDAQFRHIADKAKEFLIAEQPVISVDTKKKELIGNFRNNGQEYSPKGQPKEVNVYDFQEELLKAVPYGVYDIARNEGWVNVGISRDTAMFAVESIRRWWNGLGKARYPHATKLMITADGGGSNGSRTRLFKLELQKLANETNLEISVCHFPPGTSKWNKIEHRMFSFISQNWRARPLLDLVTVVNLIAATTTKTGLKISCEIDENIYQTGIEITKEKMENIRIKRDDFHGEWNYTIFPQKSNVII